MSVRLDHTIFNIEPVLAYPQMFPMLRISSTLAFKSLQTLLRSRLQTTLQSRLQILCSGDLQMVCMELSADTTSFISVTGRLKII